MPLPQPRFLEMSEIEARAQAVLREAQHKRIWKGDWPVPLDAIAEQHFGLTIDFDDLVEQFGSLESVGDGELLGAIDFPGKKIWINQSLDPDTYRKRRARYHFTLAHEIAHWVLHAILFRFDVNRLSPRVGEADGFIRCRGLDGASAPRDWRPRLEYQADAFAGILAMPRGQVERLWRELCGSGRAGMFESELVRLSQMSRQAVRIRIRELGLDAPPPSVRQGDLFRAA